ncbi:peptide ABC transporter substrate-binding protein [Isachenkonia alkalipeptolytica]|uniref:Peptide ABC transporter substrate-binding protein n=1 Tax=Isachenkonia alkalipeptolytica TaxID=2565777 RepID=A0AA43XI06_9CLOT|nr:peptide ABC transporter substrate-binding protein [Isachenkonia alkalipeptolytica]NBG87205.1 peptide ABC transporter substrate-binding protein [Isachenkonia alkalipeptolytica]
MINLRRMLFVGVLVLCLTVVAACGSEEGAGAEAEGEHAAPGSDEAGSEEAGLVKEDQVLNMSLGAEPDSLDVAKTSDMYSNSVLLQTMETLTRLEVDEDGETVVVPGAATEWEVSEDGMEWTFHLREAKWSDGEPLTAMDYEYGVKRILNPETASPISSVLHEVKNAQKIAQGEMEISEAGIEALDDKTLVITLEYPVPYFLSLTNGRGFIPQREDIVEEHGSSYGTEADKLVFSGPFVVEEWIHNSSITLSKNENYWDADTVMLEEVNMRIINEEAALMGELESGNIDITSVTSPEWVERLDAKGGFEKLTGDLPRTAYVFMNHEVELFSNDKVRKAFSLALDREEISRDINSGMTKPAYGWVPHPITVEDENFREYAGDLVKELEARSPEPKDLFLEGLEELGIDKDPEDISVEIMLPGPPGRELGEYFQSVFSEALGINIVLDPNEWPVFQERNRQLDYEVGFKSYGGNAYNDPSSFLNLWLTDNDIVPIGWSNEEYDRLVQEASLELDEEKRMEMYKKAEEILLIEEAAMIPYSYLVENTYVQEYVKGYMQPDFGSAVLKNIYIVK